MSELQRDASGFRVRGLAMTRIETFTDAAFAFALTLLVVSLEPPTDMEGLRQALRLVPAFLLSAAMLMMFWWGHHEWSRRYGLDDARTVLLSCILVCTVLVYVYPLRFMFGVMMEWLAQLWGVPVGGGFRIDGPADLGTIFVIYGIGFTAMSGSLLLLTLHAWSQRARLGLDAIERHETRTAIGAWAVLTATGVISATVAWLLPDAAPGLPGWVYAPLAVLMPAWARFMKRRGAWIRSTLTAHDAAPILPATDPAS